MQIQLGYIYTLTAYATSNEQGNEATLMLGAASTATGAFNTSYLGAWDTLTVGPLAWQQGTVTYTVLSGSNMIGQYLCIVLQSPLGSAMFDDVSVTGAAVVSPVTVTNTAGTVTYVNNVDYTLDSVALPTPYVATTTPYDIEEKSGGAITNGQSVDASYEVHSRRRRFRLMSG